MNKLKTYLTTSIISLFAFQTVIAQLHINGAAIHATPGSIIYVNQDSLVLENNAFFIQEGFVRVDKDVVNNNGELRNDGTIDVQENFINNDQLVGLSNGSDFFVQGNWINNNLFTPGLSTTTLDGTTQDITGTQITNFYNLVCLGSLSDVKQLVGIDANVLNQLNLGEVEFSTNVQTLSVTNEDVNAIDRINGFVSSLLDGRLNRATNTTGEYLFPVGSSLVNLRYRPISITPETANPNVYGVRFANTEATNEGFDVELMEDSLCLVNPNFYHRIYGNEQADLQMFYMPNEDGVWLEMAHWQNSPSWEDMGTEIENTQNNFTTLRMADWNNFSSPAFALAVSNPYLELGSDIEATFNEDVDLEPIYIGPSSTNILWTPNQDLTCADCLYTTANLEETTQFILTVNQGSRCAVSDSIRVVIIPEAIFLPTAFSPNNDGVNDLFRPLNTNLETWNISVWNRWGELIYQTDDLTQGWDGSYKGKKQGIGVYTYEAQYQLEGRTKEYTQKGNVTLIR